MCTCKRRSLSVTSRMCASAREELLAEHPACVQERKDTPPTPHPPYKTLRAMVKHPDLGFRNYKKARFHQSGATNRGFEHCSFDFFLLYTTCERIAGVPSAEKEVFYCLQGISLHARSVWDLCWCLGEIRG